MELLRSETETPPAFVVAAIGGGLLFLFGGVLTALTPGDRGVLIVGTIAFLLLGIYTMIVVLRQNRLVARNRTLDEELRAAHERDRGLRARLGITIREPVASVITFSDRLARDEAVAGDERRALADEIRSNARELDRALADLASVGGAHSPRVPSVVRVDEELASVAASTVGPMEFEGWLDPARAWADPATVRQLFRAILGGIRDGGCRTVILKTTSSSEMVTATLSGRCTLMGPSDTAALTRGRLDQEEGSARTAALVDAHRAIVDLGGTISHTEALGVSHIVVELPAAPEVIRAQRPRQRSVRAVPSLGAERRTPAASGSPAPSPSLRFD